MMTHSEPAQGGVLPNLIGIGAPKAATTYLARELGKHPDIYLVPSKELFLLSYGDRNLARAEYDAAFKGVQERYRLEFSTVYLSSTHALETARQFFSDQRFIVSLRNPVEQIQSHYWHLLRQNFGRWQTFDKPPSLLEALDLFPESLLEPALYGKYLDEWISAFGRDRFIILFYDDIKSDPGGVLAGICKRLDIPIRPDLLGVTKDPSTDTRKGVQPRSAMSHKLYTRLYKWTTVGPYQWLKMNFGVRRIDTLKESLHLRQVVQALFFRTGYPDIGQEGRILLTERVQKDLQHLASVIGDDRVLKWSKP